MSRRASALALAITLVLLVPVSAHAITVSAGQLHALAARAAGGDAGALAQLRAIDQVDGQPAQIAAALSAGGPAELRSRLRTLAAPGGPAGSTSSNAQATAAAVLQARRFNRAPLPDPVATGFDKVGRFLAKLARGAPGGPVAFWIVVAALVLAAASLAARRMMRRLEPAERAARLDVRGTADDPAELERLAQAAESRGAFADAVRLRFRAGLLILGSRGELDYRPSLLTGEARRTLRSHSFDELAAQFERVAYGGSRAAAPDAAAAREGWRSLLAAERR